MSLWIIGLWQAVFIGHVLRRALDFEVDGRMKKWRPKRTWKRQVEEGSVMVGL